MPGHARHDRIRKRDKDCGRGKVVAATVGRDMQDAEVNDLGYIAISIVIR
jgi:hypothetical protein